VTRQNRPHPIKVQYKVELPQEVITGNVILKPKRIEKADPVRSAVPSCPLPTAAVTTKSHSRQGNKSFSERSALRVLNEATLAQQVLQQHPTFTQRAADRPKAQ